MISHQSSSSLFNAGGIPSTSVAMPHSTVPRLTDLCKRVLKANVAHLVDVGDVPYEMVKDILPGCRVEQLREIEELSPHIADEDEEIWEYFFKRDFPIVAEARAKAAEERAKALSTGQTSSSGQKRDASARFDGADEAQTVEEEDDLFMSYRDLYYDEQVRREEKLASAGERLKERMNNLAQIKSSRQTILDPRLSLNLKKRRRGQTLPTGRSHWRQDSRPKTLTEKARARASQLAFAYEPPRPRFTRSASMQVGFIPAKPKPLYKEDSLEEIQASSSRFSIPKGIFGPRRAVPSLEACKKANEAFSGKPKTSTAHPRATPTSFVERTVSRPAKTSMERPHRPLQLPDKGVTRTIARSPSPVKAVPSSESSLVKVPSPAPADKFRNIPGITRKPLPPKLLEKESEGVSISQPDTVPSIQAISPPAASPPAASPPLESDSLAGSSLPMLSQPHIRRPPPGPSLFIPRKKAKMN